MRLIDKQAAIARMCGINCGCKRDMCGYGDSGCARVQFVEEMPAVDAAPVKHGRWAEETDRVNHWHCSECGAVWGVAHRVFKYCPNCGAKMDLGETS